MREKLILTSKCGIRHAKDLHGLNLKRYDFSADYLMKSVDGSLTRLGVEYLDVCLLHRPDYLADMKEVSDVFNVLRKQERIGMRYWRRETVLLYLRLVMFCLCFKEKRA